MWNSINVGCYKSPSLRIQHWCSCKNSYNRGSWVVFSPLLQDWTFIMFLSNAYWRWDDISHLALESDGYLSLHSIYFEVISRKWENPLKSKIWKLFITTWYKKILQTHPVHQCFKHVPKHETWTVVHTSHFFLCKMQCWNLLDFFVAHSRSHFFEKLVKNF
jgi:hypothetical protein